MADSFKEKYGPWCLVAGASEGIGAAFSRSLAMRGLNLILLARRRDKLSGFAAELRAKYSIQTEEHSIDLGDIEDARELVLNLEQEIGLLVYNAAYSPIGYFKDISESDLQKVISVNVRTPLMMVKLLSGPMIKRKKGGIILMSSLSGMQGSPKIATYAATKSFNNVLAEGLWHELREEGVDVLACAAGAVRTPGYMDSANQQDAPGTLDPKQVAEETLEFLGDAPVATPGLTNKIAKFVMGRLLPRKMSISIMHKNTRNLR